MEDGETVVLAAEEAIEVLRNLLGLSQLTLQRCRGLLDLSSANSAEVP